MEIANAGLKRYYENGFSEIEGWCSEQLFQTVDLFDSLPINKSGGVCEIGVHHGKLYLLLNQVTSNETRSFAVDIFEDAALNIDFSGSGNREIFTKNLAEFDIHRGRNTTVIQGDSTDSKLQLEKTIGPGSLRFLSIDGGHTAEHTISDLKLANHLISNEGIVILDDILNAHWLGVIEGTVHFLLGRPTLVPFALGQNKLYLSKLSFQSYYFNVLNESRLKTKVVSFFGHSLVAL
jgi:hypothetical protein